MKRKFIPVVALASCLILGGVSTITSCNNTQETKKTGTVVVSTDNHGTVVASKNSGNVGDEITLTVTANSGYELDTLTHNGTDIKASKKFTLVEGENKVVATFKETTTPTPTPSTYTVTVASGEHYTVTGLSTSYSAGDEVTFSLVVDDGYVVTSVVVDGTSLEPDENGSFAFIMPSENVTLVITVEEEAKYTVTYEASDDYTITGLEENYGLDDDVTFKVTVNNSSKRIKSVKGNGQVLTANDKGNYTFKMPAKNTTIVVELRNAIPEGAVDLIYAAEDDLGADTWSYWYADWEVACTVNDAYKTKDGVIHYDFSNVMDEKTNWHHQLFYKDSTLVAGKYKMTLKINSTAAGEITINGTTKTLVVGENDIELTYNHQTTGGTSFSLQCSLLGTAVLDISNIKYEEVDDQLPEGATAMPWVEEANLVADKWSYWNATWDDVKNDHSVNGAYVTKDGTVHFDFVDTNPYETWLEQIFYKNSSLQVGTKYTFTCVITSTAAGQITINDKEFDLVVGDNNIEVDFTQSAATTIKMLVSKLGTACIDIKNIKFDTYVAKGTITEGDLPDGVTLSYKIGDEDASLNTKYAVGTEVKVTLNDTTNTVEDVLVNNVSIKSGDEYKFTIKEGTNNVTVKIQGQTIVTKDLPIIEKGNQSTKIEGAMVWIYLDNSELGITGANATDYTVVAEVTSLTSAGADFGVSVTKYAFEDYGTNTVRLTIYLDKGPGADFTTTAKITLTHGDDVYTKTTSFTGFTWDDATPATEPTSYTDGTVLESGANGEKTRFQGAGAHIWVNTDSIGMTADNKNNYTVVKKEIEQKDAGGVAVSRKINNVTLQQDDWTNKYINFYTACDGAPADGWTTIITIYLSNGTDSGYKVTASFTGSTLNTTAA